MDLVLRLIVAVVVAVVIVWLLGMTVIPNLVVALIALAAFLVILFYDRAGGRWL